MKKKQVRHIAFAKQNKKIARLSHLNQTLLKLSKLTSIDFDILA